MEHAEAVSNLPQKRFEVYPGFPVATGPGVWFKETNLQIQQFGGVDRIGRWVDLGPNERLCWQYSPLWVL